MPKWPPASRDSSKPSSKGFTISSHIGLSKSSMKNSWRSWYRVDPPSTSTTSGDIPNSSITSKTIKSSFGSSKCSTVSTWSSEQLSFSSSLEVRECQSKASKIYGVWTGSKDSTSTESSKSSDYLGPTRVSTNWIYQTTKANRFWLKSWCWR